MQWEHACGFARAGVEHLSQPTYVRVGGAPNFTVAAWAATWDNEAPPQPPPSGPSGGTLVFCNAAGPDLVSHVLSCLLAF